MIDTRRVRLRSVITRETRTLRFVNNRGRVRLLSNRVCPQSVQRSVSVRCISVAFCVCVCVCVCVTVSPCFSSVLYEGFKSRRALMSCGHAVTPTSLTNWCRRLLDQVVLNADKKNCEIIMKETSLCFRLSPPSTSQCPGCSTSVRKETSNLSVRCAVCTANRGRVYEFCWQCLREWKGPAPRSDRCENDGCCNESLKALKNCPDITFESVTGVTGCPSIRACPTCGSLVEHSRKHCRNIVCPRCGSQFCFVCLKPTGGCYSAQCPVAPRQTSIPVWKKGNSFLQQGSIKHATINPQSKK
uniref:RING-type domain-containing protein n=1 Tax=Seriola dumerili TaxID=41447 RepID=A0A3B4TQL8_SERDU